MIKNQTIYPRLGRLLALQSAPKYISFYTYFVTQKLRPIYDNKIQIFYKPHHKLARHGKFRAFHIIF